MKLILYTSMEKNYYTRYYMKLQNVVAIVGSLLNLIKYCCYAISRIIGLNIQKLEIIQNIFYFKEKKKQNLILFNRSSNMSNNIESNITKIKNDSPLPKFSNKIKNNIQTSIFELSVIDIENSFNLTKGKQKKLSSNNLSNTLNNNIVVNNNYVDYNKNNHLKFQIKI